LALLAAIADRAQEGTEERTEGRSKEMGRDGITTTFPFIEEIGPNTRGQLLTTIAIIPSRRYRIKQQRRRGMERKREEPVPTKKRGPKAMRQERGGKVKKS